MLHKAQNRKQGNICKCCVYEKGKPSNPLLLQNPKPKYNIKHLGRGKNTPTFCQCYVFNKHEICKNHDYFL